MQVTNAEMYAVVTALKALSMEKVPAKFAWKVQTSRKTLEPFVETFLTALQDIQTKYALRNAEGELEPGVDQDGKPIPNTVRIPPDKVPEANKEMEELLTAKVTVENVGFHVNDIPDTLEVTADTLEALSPIIHTA